MGRLFLSTRKLLSSCRLATRGSRHRHVHLGRIALVALALAGLLIHPAPAYAAVTISGQVYDDLNGNGVKDGGEPGRQGILVTIDFGADGSVDTSTTTGPTGAYSVNVAGPDTYRVRIVLPSGEVQSTTDPADTFQSDGGSITNVDFGLFVKTSITGFVFEDYFADGVYAPLALDGPMASVGITLDAGADGTVDQSTVTDGTGHFTFTNLGPGTYRVRAIPLLVTDTQTTPQPVDIVTHSATNVTVPNIGLFHAAHATSTVFEDVNGNGFFDTGDRLLQGATVTLDSGINGTIDQSVQTNAAGVYSFQGLVPGIYRIGLVPLSPNDFVSTIEAFNPQSGANKGAPISVFHAATVSGQVFDDLNSDGVRNPGEPGRTGIRITGSRTFSFTTTTDARVTDASGAYSFTNVGSGTFTLVADRPTTGRFTTPLLPLLNPHSGSTSAGNDVGLFTYGTITGTVFDDSDGDGVKGPDETGIGGVSVRIEPSPALFMPPPLAITDGNGNYTIPVSTAGTYRLVMIVPSGYKQLAASTTDIVIQSGTVVRGANLPLTNLTPTINCTGSHRIVISTSAESGQLTVTVRPRDPHDDLLELRFGSATRPLVNALLDLPDGRHGVSQGTTYAANGGAPSITFSVRRQQAGPVTVPLTVVDRCPTPWETFVGGGSGAF